MSTEELIGKIWGLVEAWGPIVLVAYGLFALLVLGIIVAVFISTMRSFRQFDREWDNRHGGRF